MVEAPAVTTPQDVCVTAIKPHNTSRCVYNSREASVQEVGS